MANKLLNANEALAEIAKEYLKILRLFPKGTKFKAVVDPKTGNFKLAVKEVPNGKRELTSKKR